MKSGLVEVFKLGRDYKFVKSDTKDGYEFIYKDSNGETKRDDYRYVVNARGQAKSIQTDPSPLMKNLLQRGIVQIEETQHGHEGNIQSSFSANHLKTGFQTYKTSSMRIDPKTHHIMRSASDRTTTQSNAIYAVGAMTRGQIIDASMAQGIVQSIARVADSLVDSMK
jgi:uncharacterized NAD(P)/FAD-binding protein YdhS